MATIGCSVAGYFTRSGLADAVLTITTLLLFTVVFVEVVRAGRRLRRTH